MASLNGEPRDGPVPVAERNQIESELIYAGEKLAQRSPDYRPDVGGILPDGTLYCPYKFLHEIRTGERYGHNPFLADIRLMYWTDETQTSVRTNYEVPSSSNMSNYQCWREITDAQVCEVFYYGQNPHLPNPKVTKSHSHTKNDTLFSSPLRS